MGLVPNIVVINLIFNNYEFDIYLSNKVVSLKKKKPKIGETRE